jgi:hypothetical protein
MRVVLHMVRTQMILMLLAAAVSACGQRLRSPSELASAGPGHPSAPPACSIARVDIQPIRLDDGRIVTIDAKGVAVNDGSALIIGNYVHVFPAGSTNANFLGLVLTDSILGVLRDRSGRLHLVPSPLPGRSVEHPRAASAGADGWHVLFATPSHGGAASPSDSVFLWYGRYDGQHWHGLERVAWLAPDELGTLYYGSRLVASADGDLSFARPSGHGYPPDTVLRGDHGVVMAQRRGAHWHLDTLRTWETPTYVELVPVRGSRTVLATFSVSYFRDHRSWPGVFVARYDSLWRASRLVAGGTPRPVYASTISSSSTATVVSWESSHGTSVDSTQIEEAWLRADDTTLHHEQVGTVYGLDGFGLAALPGGRALWVFHDGDTRAQLHVVMGTETGLRDLGFVRVPFDNITPVAAALSNDRALIVTLALGKEPGDPPAMTYLTRIDLTCARNQ